MKEVCGDDEAFFDLQVRLLGIEQQPSAACRGGPGIFDRLEQRLRAGIYRSEKEAVTDLTERGKRTEEAKARARPDDVVHVRPVETQLGLLREEMEREGG